MKKKNLFIINIIKIKKPLISILANNWRFFKDLSYILVILITIITMVK